MNKELYQISAENILRRFPAVLRQDETMETFAQIVSDELGKRIPETDLPRLLTRIDELPEPILDALAEDFKIDWYNFNYSIDSKRALVKSSFYVHRFLGTPAAVNAMLSSVFPGSYIEEWFSYGGRPHHFQVVIETKAAREPLDADEIMRAVRMVKRLSSHLDGIIYQCDMGIIVETTAKPFRVKAAWPGRHYSGTIPKREVQGVFTEDRIRIETTGETVMVSSDYAGTKPDRATHAAFHAGELDITTQGAVYAATAESAGRSYAGTIPDRSTHGGAASGEVAVETKTEATEHGSTFTGTEPYRTTSPAFTDTQVVPETRTDHAEATAPVSGRRDKFQPRNVHAATSKTGVDIETKGRVFERTQAVSGKPEPFTQSPVSGILLPGGLCAVIEGKEYIRRVPWCGRKRCGRGGRRL